MSGETSASNGPEIQANNAALYENVDPNETFDNLDYESESSKKVGEEYAKKFADKIKHSKSVKEEQLGEKEPKEEKKETAKKKSEMATLSDSEDLEEGKKDEKKDSDKTKPGDKEDEKPKEELEEGKALDKETKGKIKLRMGEDLYGVDTDSLVRYKVDGEWVERPLQEVLNKASGVEALDKKFTEYGQKNKELQARESQVLQYQKNLQAIEESVSNILKDPNKNPFDALKIIVEKSGGDPYTLWRRSIESSLDVIEQLQDMTEAERKAFFLEKKDEFRTQAEEARIKAEQDAKSNQQAIQEADALRQAHGVSEEQFLKAWDDLEAQGVQNPTNEHIVDYASIKPHLDSVQDILEPYEAFIDDNKYGKVVTDFARKLRAKEITPEQLKEICEAEFQDEDLKDLTARKAAKTKTPTKVSAKEETPTSGKHSYESFDDFDD